MFATEVSNVRAFEVSFNPVPKRLLKDDPFKMRFEVDAMAKDE